MIYALCIHVYICIYTHIHTLKRYDKYEMRDIYMYVYVRVPFHAKKGLPYD